MENFEINQSMLLEFRKVLSHGLVTTLYQPIVDLRKSEIFGYEALSRGPENSVLHSPLVLLSIAELLNKTWELEQLLRVKALEQASFTADFKLFLNVDPNVIRDPKFKKGFTKENLKQLNISPDSVVLEITERSAIDSYEDFKEILKHYKEQGYHIAIDDVGSGYSGLKTLYEIYPRFLKIDMDFIRHIDKDKFKQAIVKSFIEMAKLASMKTVAEGIETEEELKMLIGMGVDYGQGYFIQRPGATIRPLEKKVEKIIEKENKLIKQIISYSQDYHYIHHIMKEINTFEKSTPCKGIQDYLNQNELTSVAVVENHMPKGMVTLREINKVFAKQYGYSVYAHRPVELIMDKRPMIVDYYMPIQDVAREALKRANDELYDDIIVVKGHAYAGTVTMRDLLDYGINYEKKYAKELNPLTGLPGNVIINRVMQNAVESDRQTCIIYVDLDHFKVFNDVFGFEKGDQILKMTADILKKAVNDFMPYNAFLGHIGGDDFIIVTDGHAVNLQEFCVRVIASFDEEIQSHFDDVSLNTGKLRGKGRDGLVHEYNLTSISLAGLLGAMNQFVTVENLGGQLAGIKKEVKKIENSSYMLSVI